MRWNVRNGRFALGLEDALFEPMTASWCATNKLLQMCPKKTWEKMSAYRPMMLLLVTYFMLKIKKSELCFFFFRYVGICLYTACWQLAGACQHISLHTVQQNKKAGLLRSAQNKDINELGPF
jgi:hypothetical protein